jgi:tetratricopeptide (TPR) repeat protein
VVDESVIYFHSFSFRSMLRSQELIDALTLADSRTIARGKAYFHEGAVLSLEDNERSVRAVVRGTHRYHVNLTAGDDGALLYECNCPVGQDDIFCKHVVAVVYACLDNAGGEFTELDDPRPVRKRAKRKTRLDLLREYLDKLDAEALRELLFRAASQDKALRDELLFSARAASVDDLPGMKLAVREAVRVSGSADWRAAGDYATRLESIAELLRQWLSGPHAEAVVELSELAIAGAEKGLGLIDDSGGYVMPAIHALAEIHLDACRLTRPEPVRLAERLFRFQVQGEWDTFHNVLPAYADPLEDAGLEKYRELVEAAWDALLPLSAESGQGSSFDSNRFRLEHAMLALADLDGDTDAQIRIRSKDLSTPYRFFQLAEACAKHGRYDDALLWASRGIERFPGPADERLLNFCVDAYLRRGDAVSANDYAWRRFTARPLTENFTRLMVVAKATGTEPAVRERALEHMWSLVRQAEEGVKDRRNVWHSYARSELVSMHLSEQDVDAAWQVFQGGPVSSGLWAELAAARGKTHPHDAISLYHRLLPVALKEGSVGARYDKATEVVRRIGALRTALKEEAEFARELAAIRNTWRAKRNFMKLLDALSWR